MKKFLIIITGPTASGKTAVSIQVAQHFHTEIISADARQFYREMNIGTAKPTSKQLSEVTHHFINNLSIHDVYSAGIFEHEALATLDHLFRTHDIAVFTGGSGLFLKSVLEGFDSFPPVDESVKEKIKMLFKEEGIAALQEKLKEVDPSYYDKVDLKNSRRIIRALEVSLSGGKPFSEFRTAEKKKRNFSVIKIELQLERKELYDRINRRVETMMQEGLLIEAKKLFPHRHLIPLQTVGYSELFDFLEGKIAFEKAIELIKQNTRNYAKRQMTWFRKEKDIHWFHPENVFEIISHIETHMH